MINIVIPTTIERRARLSELVASIYEHTNDIEHNIVVYENDLGGWCPAVHHAIKDIDGYVMLLGSDVVVKAGWLRTLWDAFITKFPDGRGAAQPFDEIHHGALCQHPLAHTDTIKKYLHLGYLHNFSDNEMTDRLKADGRYLYVPEAIIEHKHMINGKAPEDETYRKVFNRVNWEKDKQLYYKRRANNFKD